MSAHYPRVLSVGDAAVTVEFGERIDSLLAARVRSLDRRLEGEPFPGLREAVPTYRSLLVVFDPLQISQREVGRILLERAGDAAAEDVSGRLHVIETVYGGQHGPDLALVARARGLTEKQVVELHSGRDYTAFMLGFTPGFAYLGPLADELVVPRLATPRPLVPAGSVAIAANQTAVYPSATPGGWHILGRTAARLFDPLAQPPARIAPGDRVRFVPVEASTREAEPPSPPAVPRPSALASLDVLEAGLLTTVQDGGRRGNRRWGVTWAGAADAPSHAAANLLVGNGTGEAALECTVAGPKLRFLHGTLFAVTGADLGAVLERADLGRWAVPLGACVRARPGNVLAFSGRSRGCRAYVAFAGGIDVPAVLGSRATDLAAGFGGLDGRALRAGDTLALGHAGEGAAPAARSGAAATLAPPEGAATLRVVLGPQAECFSEEALERFLSETYQLDATSDRRGCRLVGPPLTHRGTAEIVSDGMLPGSIQVPADGRPIVMLADSPTTGGYAKIATVVTSDLPLLAQLLPGEGRVRFEVVAPEDATRLP